MSRKQNKIYITRFVVTNGITIIFLLYSTSHEIYLNRKESIHKLLTRALCRIDLIEGEGGHICCVQYSSGYVVLRRYLSILNE